MVNRMLNHFFLIKVPADNTRRLVVKRRHFVGDPFPLLKIFFIEQRFFSNPSSNKV